eukprot:8615468-Alexandrium_andersonii.AAC.1
MGRRGPAPPALRRHPPLAQKPARGCGPCASCGGQAHGWRLCGRAHPAAGGGGGRQRRGGHP